MQAAGQLPTPVLGLTPTATIAAQYPMAGGYFTRQGIFLIFFCIFYPFLNLSSATLYWWRTIRRN